MRLTHIVFKKYNPVKASVSYVQVFYVGMYPVASGFSGDLASSEAGVGDGQKGA